MSDELNKIFNNLKNLLYNSDYKKYKLEDLAIFITKKDKTEEESKRLEEILSYVEDMERSIIDLGTKIGTINSELFNAENIDSYKRIEEHVRDIVFYMDEFIDAISALTKTMNIGDTKFDLKKASSYLKSTRNHFVQKAGEFRIKALRNSVEKENFRFVVNDALDVFVKEAYSLRISILGEKIRKVLENG
jgi:hypothetical protein